MPVPRSFAAVLLGAALLAPARALAAEPESAQALYDRGLAAMKAGRFEEACPALERSYKLDPLPGALFTLAECEAKGGHHVAAAVRYDQYLRVYAALPPEKQAKQGDREKLARSQRDALASKVAELTLVLPPGAPWDTKVTYDGQPLTLTALGSPKVVDPGEHVVEVRVGDAPPRKMSVTLAPGEKKGVALDVGKGPAPLPPGLTQPPPAPPPRSGTSPNTIVLATGASLAGAALITSAVLAGLYAMKGSEAASDNAKVPKNEPCPANSSAALGNCGNIVSALNAQATFGTVAIGTFAAGAGVGIVTLVAALIAPKAPTPPVAPVVVGNGGGLVLRGSF